MDWHLFSSSKGSMPLRRPGTQYRHPRCRCWWWRCRSYLCWSHTWLSSWSVWADKWWYLLFWYNQWWWWYWMLVLTRDLLLLVSTFSVKNPLSQFHDLHCHHDNAWPMVIDHHHHHHLVIFAWESPWMAAVQRCSCSWCRSPWCSSHPGCRCPECRSDLGKMLNERQDESESGWTNHIWLIF